MHSTRPNEQPFCKLRAYIILATVTSASYSFLIQSISRLFFIWFHTNRILISWRTHWILIVIKYTLSYLISIQPFFVEHGFDFIDDVRMCSITMKIPLVSLYTLIMSSLLPTNGVIIIYSILLYRIRCLVRRVSPMINRSPRVIIAKRNLKILQHILILLSILACGSIPFGIVCFWNIISDHDVPEEMHFISVNFLVLSATVMTTVLVFRNKMVKDILVKFYQLRCQ
ncbi:hypothetical protein I4U23_015362 [Adineta vaga]|nr:hypothetical protein I4U23_015362 [Adineta vaga]